MDRVPEEEVKEQFWVRCPRMITCLIPFRQAPHLLSVTLRAARLVWGNGMRESREVPSGVFLEVASSTEAGIGKKLSWLRYHESHSTHTSQSSLWS